MIAQYLNSLFPEINPEVPLLEETGAGADLTWSLITRESNETSEG